MLIAKLVKRINGWMETPGKLLQLSNGNFVKVTQDTLYTFDGMGNLLQKSSVDCEGICQIIKAPSDDILIWDRSTIQKYSLRLVNHKNTDEIKTGEILASTSPKSLMDCIISVLPLRDGRFATISMDSSFRIWKVDTETLQICFYSDRLPDCFEFLGETNSGDIIFSGRKKVVFYSLALRAYENKAYESKAIVSECDSTISDLFAHVTRIDLETIQVFLDDTFRMEKKITKRLFGDASETEIRPSYTIDDLRIHTILRNDAYFCSIKYRCFTYHEKTKNMVFYDLPFGYTVDFAIELKNGFLAIKGLCSEESSESVVICDSRGFSLKEIQPRFPTPVSILELEDGNLCVGQCLKPIAISELTHRFLFVFFFFFLRVRR